MGLAGMKEKEDRKKLTSSPAWWQAIQFVLLCIFVLQLYAQEGHVLQTIAEEALSTDTEQTARQLEQMQPAFLPGQFWRLVWPLFCVSIGLLFFSRWRWYFFGLVGLVSSLFLIADEVYYSFFSSIISHHSFQASHQLWTVRESVTAALPWFDLLQAALFLGFVVYGVIQNRTITKKFQGHSSMLFPDKGLALVALLLALYAAFLGYRIPLSHYRDAQNGGADNTAAASIEHFVPNFMSSNKDFARSFGVFNFHLKDFAEALFHSPSEIGDEGLAIAETVLRQSEVANRRTSPFFGVARGRNVIVVSMEAFQHFLLDLKVNDFEITPVLNEIKTRSFSWNYILDNATRGGTSDAEFSVLTGLMPDPQQIASLNHPTNNTLLGLPSSLRERGYRTLSLHGNDAAFWNRDVNHPILGIDTLHFAGSFDYKKLGLGVPDEVFFDQSAALLEDETEPFFAFMISLTSHHPYNILPPGEKMIPLDMPAHAMATRYLRAVHYADRTFGQFLRHLKEKGMLEDTMFVIYGDHIAPMNPGSRELMKKHAGVDPGALRENRIPFLIYMPGIDIHSEDHRDIVDAVGGLQDLYPTVLHLLGIDIPYGIFGTHLFVPNQERPVIPYFKYQNGFIANGALYTPYGYGPVTDERGPLFVAGEEALTLTREQLQTSYNAAAMAVQTHRLIFDGDAQIKVRGMNPDGESTSPQSSR